MATTEEVGVMDITPQRRISDPPATAQAKGTLVTIMVTTGHTTTDTGNPYQRGGLLESLINPVLMIAYPRTPDIDNNR